MTRTEKYNIVLEFATMAHSGQKRKYSDDDYIIHPIAVAELVAKKGGDTNQVLAALLHDVVEDTPFKVTDIYSMLLDKGFSTEDAEDVTQLVYELTDVYTKEKYPDLNRAKRKAKEAERLGASSARGQFIKACDMIDNTTSIVDNDPGFAKVYLREKGELARKLNKIPHSLFSELMA